MKSDIIDLAAQLRHETEKARLFLFEMSDDPIWLPKSQHEWDPDDQTVTLKENVALEKGLI